MHSVEEFSKLSAVKSEIIFRILMKEALNSSILKRDLDADWQTLLMVVPSILRYFKPPNSQISGLKRP